MSRKSERYLLSSRLQQGLVSTCASCLAIVLVGLSLGGWPAPMMATEPEHRATPPRLAFIAGEASFLAAGRGGLGSGAAEHRTGPG